MRLVVVVSEESGQIRIAERGRLMLVANSEELEIELKKRLHPQAIKQAIEDAVAAAQAEVAAAEACRHSTPPTRPPTRSRPSRTISNQKRASEERYA